MPGSRKGSEASNISRKNEILQENVLKIHEVLEKSGNMESPIDINLSYTVSIHLPHLEWHHEELVPKKMKLTNSGHTVILSAKWNQERPYLTGGPFLGNYVFSQLHFHWGANNMEGSEHTIDGGKMPMEMHIVFFKSSYLTQEAALRQKDGVAVLAYFFKLQGFPNPSLQALIDNFGSIKKPHNSIKLLPPFPLTSLFNPFFDDYFLYWGSVMTSSCVHSILWLICRHAIGISMEQMDEFRTLLDINEEPLLRNFRSVTDVSKWSSHIYHISPSKTLYSTLFQYPPEVLTVPKRRDSTENYRCEIQLLTPFNLPAWKKQEHLSILNNIATRRKFSTASCLELPNTSKSKDVLCNKKKGCQS